MLITADQLLAHAIGDYLLQSHWMATEKTKRSLVAGIHAACYFIPFCFLQPSKPAIAVIVGTHFLIDRFRLARYVIYAKNLLSPKYTSRWSLDGRVKGKSATSNWPPWAECRKTGYHVDAPDWLAVWLLIIADNILHIVINGAALKYL